MVEIECRGVLVITANSSRTPSDTATICLARCIRKRYLSIMLRFWSQSPCTDGMIGGKLEARLFDQSVAMWVLGCVGTTQSGFSRAT